MLIFLLPTSSPSFYFLILYKTEHGRQVELGWISSPLFSSWMPRPRVWHILNVKQMVFVCSLFHNTYYSDEYTSEVQNTTTENAVIGLGQQHAQIPISPTVWTTSDTYGPDDPR